MRIDKNNPSFMKEYLRQVVTFEKKIFIWEKALQTSNNKHSTLQEEKNDLMETNNAKMQELSNVDGNVKNEIQEVKSEITRLTESIRKSKKTQLISVFTLILGVFFVVLFIKSLLDGVIVDGEVTALTLILALLLQVGIIMAPVSVVVFFVTGASRKNSIFLISKYEANLNNNFYFAQGVERKQSLNRDLTNLSAGIQKYTHSIQITVENRAKIQSALSDAKRVLSDMYAMNVLPEKYRSLNATATLYEYLENGICTTVMGHGGIYDTYEYHVRLGLIITRLDDIIRRLDRIIENQNYLYNAICECNNSLKKIDNDILSAKQAFEAYSAASLELQAQTYAQVAYYNWKNS